MGIAYYLINHQNATYYELGKGYWEFLENHEWPDAKTLYNALITTSLAKGIEPGDRMAEYWKKVCIDIIKFIGDTPREYIQLGHDAGTDWITCHNLKYEFIHYLNL